jgi:S1-C subfamily serine protease
LKPEIKWSKGINIKYRAQQPKKGDLVFTLGYPLYYGYPYYIISEPTLSVGFFSNVLEEGGIRRFVINAAFNVGNSGGPLFDLQGGLLGIVQAKSILKHPMIQIAFQILEKPGVEIIYAKIKLPNGSEREMTLGGIIRMLISWIADNVQTNIGEAIPAEYLME